MRAERQGPKGREKREKRKEKRKRQDHLIKVDRKEEKERGLLHFRYKDKS